METALVQQENIMNIGKLAPDALSLNTQSQEKCIQAGNNLLKRIETEGMSDSLDEDIAKYIKRVKQTGDAMNERRIPVTKLFDNIRSIFTEMENSISVKSLSSPAYKLQEARNNYVKKKLNDQERIRKEDELRLLKIKDKADFRSRVEVELYNYFNAYMTDQLQLLVNLNKFISLDNFDKSSESIVSFSVEYPQSHYRKFTSGAMIPSSLSINDAQAIIKEVTDCKYCLFAAQYKEMLSDQRDVIAEVLPSKKQELLLIEEQRKTDDKTAQQMVDNMERKEKEENDRLEAERAEKERKGKEEISNNQKLEEMGALFATAMSSSAPSVVKVQTKKKIQIIDQRGFLDILNMWWSNEGCLLCIEELEKKLKPMITSCEKLANDKNNPRLIQSEFIDYIDEIKAK